MSNRAEKIRSRLGNIDGNDRRQQIPPVPPLPADETEQSGYEDGNYA